MSKNGCSCGTSEILNCQSNHPWWLTAEIRDHDADECLTGMDMEIQDKKQKKWKMCQYRIQFFTHKYPKLKYTIPWMHKAIRRNVMTAGKRFGCSVPQAKRMERNVPYTSSST